MRHTQDTGLLNSQLTTNIPLTEPLRGSQGLF